MTHGSYSSYSRGCRCHECTLAHRQYNRDARVRRSERKSHHVPHGTYNGYANYLCRCDKCREAAARHMRTRPSYIAKLKGKPQGRPRKYE